LINNEAPARASGYEMHFERLSWGFPYAVRLYYGDPTLNGILVQNSAALPSVDKGSAICFDSTSDAAGIAIAKRPAAVE
jgi:hypothetical protein